MSCQPHGVLSLSGQVSYLVTGVLSLSGQVSYLVTGVNVLSLSEQVSYSVTGVDGLSATCCPLILRTKSKEKSYSSWIVNGF